MKRITFRHLAHALSSTSDTVSQLLSNDHQDINQCLDEIVKQLNLASCIKHDAIKPVLMPFFSWFFSIENTASQSKEQPDGFIEVSTSDNQYYYTIMLTALFFKDYIQKATVLNTITPEASNRILSILSDFAYYNSQTYLIKQFTVSKQDHNIPLPFIFCANGGDKGHAIGILETPKYIYLINRGYGTQLPSLLYQSQYSALTHQSGVSLFKKKDCIDSRALYQWYNINFKQNHKLYTTLDEPIHLLLNMIDHLSDNSGQLLFPMKAQKISNCTTASTKGLMMAILHATNSDIQWVKEHYKLFTAQTRIALLDEAYTLFSSPTDIDVSENINLAKKKCEKKPYACIANEVIAKNKAQNPVSNYAMTQQVTMSAFEDSYLKSPCTLIPKYISSIKYNHQSAHKDSLTNLKKYKADLLKACHSISFQNHLPQLQSIVSAKPASIFESIVLELSRSWLPAKLVEKHTTKSACI
ncbi:hypothetical protein OAT84_03065 [Gammaproteobacteria bacterium]|nr:hypothetical protein [Gammaproteobacteria bacterium]